MSEHDLEKLLGGFAADTLTPEEKQTLYTTALQDQQLFNALADEQPLKELLSDPDVRRRLLASLEQKSASTAGGSPAWLDWFRRPAGLVFAGGLAAAALAVVLGVRIYQDSLRQAAQSVGTEDAKPATPQAIEPQPKAKENVAPAIDLPKKDMLVGKLAKPEPSVPPPSKKERASDVALDRLKQRSEQDEVRRQAQAPVAAPSKSSEEVASSADQKLSASSAAPATTPEPKKIQMPAGRRIAATATPVLSAHALFYGGEPELSRLGKAAGTVAHIRPLGLRYSFVVRGTDGQEREVDATTASKSIQSVFLTVEANQDAYLQVWETVGSSTPQLLWPEKEAGQISLKITAGQRQQIPLPMEMRPVTLTARLSRVPSGPITRQDAALFDRLSSNQLQESITPSGAAGSQERATYIVNQDPSTTAQLAVDITLGR
jgi:hypothetical protein